MNNQNISMSKLNNMIPSTNRSVNESIDIPENLSKVGDWGSLNDSSFLSREPEYNSSKWQCNQCVADDQTNRDYDIGKDFSDRSIKYIYEGNSKVLDNSKLGKDDYRTQCIDDECYSPLDGLQYDKYNKNKDKTICLTRLCKYKSKI